MKYTTFNQQSTNPLIEPMFFGNPVNVARYDQQKHAIFEKLIEKQISFFWRPEEVDVSRDRVDFQKLTDPEKHIFISNLKYQTLLDSVQGRSPNIAFLPIISLPELETWVETLSRQKTYHFERVSECKANNLNGDSAECVLVNVPQMLSKTTRSTKLVSFSTSESPIRKLTIH